MMWRMRQVAGLLAVLALHAAGLVSATPPARAADPAPAGQITYAVHFTLAPRWLDPGDNEGTITPCYDRAIYAPIWENGFIRGVGPRVDEPALALIPYFRYSAPYEELWLKP